MNKGLMRYAVANTSYVSFQKSNRIPIYMKCTNIYCEWRDRLFPLSERDRIG
ncbi:hypothetical protein [Nostoc commune]|uniref:hypothetical protein n=1 Tax=Nostoc commune TaxID=1178 RepID=UPI0015E7EC00|nr:hypothetical protein [Nostoc commune]